MKNLSKILLITAITAAIGVGMYFGWQYFFGKRAPSPITPEERIAQFIVKPKGISDNPVFDYWVNKNTGDIYYLDLEGNIYKVTSAGENQSTGSKATGNLNYIKPSPSGSLAVVAFGYPQNPTFAIHDLSKKTWQALPAGTTAIAWDPLSNNRLAYLKDNGTIGKLYFFTISDSKSTEVARINQKDLDLDWVLSDTIYFRERPSGQYAGSLRSYHLNKKIFKTVIGEELGLSLQWNRQEPMGLKLSNNALSVIDHNNRILAGLAIKTPPSKCTFGELRIYCAVPNNQTIIPPAAFPDGYLKKSFRSLDDVYLISFLGLGQNPDLLAIKVFDSFATDFPMEADHLEIQNNRLLFINRLDNKLYSLSL